MSYHTIPTGLFFMDSRQSLSQSVSLTSICANCIKLAAHLSSSQACKEFRYIESQNEVEKSALSCKMCALVVSAFKSDETWSLDGEVLDMDSPQWVEAVGMRGNYPGHRSMNDSNICAVKISLSSESRIFLDIFADTG